MKSESEVAQSCPTLCDPIDTRLLRPWDFLGKSTGVRINDSRRISNLRAYGCIFDIDEQQLV